MGRTGRVDKGVPNGGRRVRLHGMVGIGADGGPAMVNPAYDLLG